MAQEVFGIDKIKELDGGRPAAQINKLLRMCTDDCMNRPGVEGARKVTITITQNPIKEEGGVCEEVTMEVQSKISVPAMISKAFSMGVHATKGLWWNKASEGNVHQGTLDDGGDPPI